MTMTATEAGPTAEAAPEAPQAFTPPRKGEIFKAMSAVMAKIVAVGKDHRNVSQNYSFRSIDDAYDAVQPALVEVGVSCIPRVLEYRPQPVKGKVQEDGTQKEGTHMLVKMEFEWCAGDGSSIRSTMVGEAIDFGDKAAAKAASMAYKYALFQTFCIPIGGNGQDRDPDFSSPEADAGGGDGGDGPTTMPFGKHKGTAVADVPDDYLRWCLGSMEKLRPAMRAVLEAEVERRATASGDAAPPSPAEAEAPTQEDKPQAAGKVCPDCGKPLVQRARKDGTGKFMGCSGYPGCKHTEKAPSDKKPKAKPRAQDGQTLGQEIVALTLQMAGGIQEGMPDKEKAAVKDKARRMCCAIASTVLGRAITMPEQIQTPVDQRAVRDELKDRIAAAKKQVEEAKDEFLAADDDETIPF
jgi:ERF superfamily/Topoisomerase DNA binding C4 zinc finger/Putative quorum-sensing-regulated virulence factor